MFFFSDKIVDVPDTCTKKKNVDFNRRRSYNVDELLSSSPLQCMLRFFIGDESIFYLSFLMNRR